MRFLAFLAPVLLCCTSQLAKGFPLHHAPSPWRRSASTAAVEHRASPPSHSPRILVTVCRVPLQSRPSRTSCSKIDDMERDVSREEKVDEEETMRGASSPTRRRRRRPMPKVGTTLVSTMSGEDSPGNAITYLGSGKDAIVRLGCVLVAPDHETRHFLRRAAIFVYAMGERPVDTATGVQQGDTKDEYVIRGLILDQPTAFTLSEMMPGIDPSNLMADLPVFRGGDSGQDGLILLQTSRRDVERDDNDDPEGTGGATATRITGRLYHGGWDEALRAGSHPEESNDATRKFKVFFNYLEFTEAQLEDLLASSDTDDEDDMWMSLEVPPAAVLNSEYGPGAAWASFRNAVAQMRQQSSGDT